MRKKMANKMRTYTTAHGKMTAHSTKAHARMSVHEAHNPVLVLMNFGTDQSWYDAYPAGYPLPACVTPIERCSLTASGYRWHKLDFDATGRYHGQGEKR